MIDAMKQALEYLDSPSSKLWPAGTQHKIITALRLAIEQAEKQEPVLKPCWYESKEKTMCRKCGQVHAEAIFPNQEKQEPVAWQATADKCQIETVPAKGGLLPTAPPQRQPHELLCVCGASWSIDGEGNEELLSTPPQRQPLQVDKDGWYWVSENECISVDLIRTVEKLHGIGGEA
jgi:hypothetical protein